MNKTILIFDLDGTLWDSGAQVADSWNIILSEQAPALANLTADDIHSVMGLTMREIADRLFTPAGDDMKYALMDECSAFEVEYITKHGGVMYDGVHDTLKKLKNDGYLLAIVSNCQKGYIQAFLDSMSMSEYFCDIEEWGNTRLSKGENIRLVMNRLNAESAIYIGDTMGDYNAASSAGIPFIHAAYGFGKVPGVPFIKYFSELPYAICNIINEPPMP